MVLDMKVDAMIFEAMKRPIITTVKPLVSLCGWCPDAKQRTAEAVANGADVSHTICPSCSTKVFGEL